MFNLKNKKNNPIWVASAFAIVILIVFSISFSRYWKVKNMPCYTVGVTTDIVLGSRNAKYIKYYFKTNDKLYVGKTSMYSPYDSIGSKYMVAYYRKNPNINVLLLKHQLNDSLSLGAHFDSTKVGAPELRFGWF